MRVGMGCGVVSGGLCGNELKEERVMVWRGKGMRKHLSKDVVYRGEEELWDCSCSKGKKERDASG